MRYLQKSGKLAHIVFPIPVRSAIEYSNTNRREGDMNARNSTMTKTSFALTSLTVCSALAMFAGACASSNDDGVMPTGGTGGGGSSGAACSNPDKVEFATGAATCAMSGWGWIALGVKDNASDPTCGGAAITHDNPCLTSTTWNATDALCITGSIPALPAQPVQKDYDDNWGVQIGVDATVTPGTPIGKQYSAIAIEVTGSPTAGLRVELHKAGDPEATTYCATNTGAPIALTNFNTACWDNTGKAFTLADAPQIDKVGIQVSSTQSAITVANLCLKSITFGK
jgi:hypothetical protein